MDRKKKRVREIVVGGEGGEITKYQLLYKPSVNWCTMYNMLLETHLLSMWTTEYQYQCITKTCKLPSSLYCVHVCRATLSIIMPIVFNPISWTHLGTTLSHVHACSYPDWLTPTYPGRPSCLYTSSTVTPFARNLRTSALCKPTSSMYAQNNKEH